MENKMEEQKDALSSSLPELGHQLILKSDIDGWYRLKQTRKQQIGAYTLLLGKGILIAAVVCFALFGADFFMDYAHRGENFLAFFWKFLVGAFFLVGLYAYIKLVRYAVVFWIHPRENRLMRSDVVDKNASANAEMSFRDIDKVEVVPASGVLDCTRLVVRSVDDEFVLAQCFGDYQDLITLRDWLNEHRMVEEKSN